MAVKTRLVGFLLWLGLLPVAGTVQALGLGDIRVESALNQPFQAMIPVHGSAGIQPHELQVRLADQAAFQRIGMSRDPVHAKLRFEAQGNGQQLQIRVSSRDAIQEPYLSFLLEVQGAGSTLLREFNILLDPPLYQPRPITRNVQSRSPAQAATREPVQVADAVSGQGEDSTPALQPAPGALIYVTQSGDSLWSIANRFNPHPSIPVTRVMQAIHQLNPHAFVRGDINRLRVGQTLVLPTAEQLGVNLQLRTPDNPVPPEPVTEDASVTPAATAPVQVVDDRLRIDEGSSEPLFYQDQMDHLNALEARFNLMLDELEEKDRQVALLESRLADIRKARGLDESATSVSDAPVTEPADGPVADEPAAAVESVTEVAEVTTNAPAAPAWLNWWPVLLALLAAVLAVLLVRERKADTSEDEDLPEPVLAARVGLPPVSPMPLRPSAIPLEDDERSKPDPLDGVELYLAYGRLAEGRDMLEAAIEEEPQRLDLRFKLLRVLGELEDYEAFAGLEQDLLERGADPLRIKAIRARFDALQQSPEFDSPTPMLDEQQEAELFAEQRGPQGSLGDFTDQPNLDLFDSANTQASDKGGR